MKFKIILLAFFAVFIGFSISCKKEESNNVESQLVGKWKLTTKTVDNQSVQLTDCETLSRMEFQEKNLCIISDSCAHAVIRSGWSYKYDMLNIAKQLPAAYYIISVTSTDLQLKRNDFSAEGKLQVSVFNYSKIAE